MATPSVVPAPAAASEETTVQELFSNLGINFCTEPACQRVTRDVSKRCSLHREQQITNILVHLTSNDLQWLDDCDDVIFGLVQDGCRYVKILLEGDLAKVRHKMLDGFGPDVGLIQKDRGNGGPILLRYKHNRGGVR